MTYVVEPLNSGTSFRAEVQARSSKKSRLNIISSWKVSWTFATKGSGASAPLAELYKLVYTIMYRNVLQLTGTTSSLGTAPNSFRHVRIKSCVKLLRFSVQAQSFARAVTHLAPNLD
jgi:hypothetical protein